MTRAVKGKGLEASEKKTERMATRRDGEGEGQTVKERETLVLMLPFISPFKKKAPEKTGGGTTARQHVPVLLETHSTRSLPFDSFRLPPKATT